MTEILIEDSSDIQENKKIIITKLAIGKPGGVDLEPEKWEMKLKILCLNCKKDFSTDLNEIIKNTVNYILNSSSASESNELKAWELEIKPCKHTLELVQDKNVKILSKNEAQCNDCNLNSNLWLCLTCGNLGCGRKQWDGTGGNGHGLSHFEETKHPISVKTGTITPNGEACKNNIIMFNYRNLKLYFAIFAEMT